MSRLVSTVLVLSLWVGMAGPADALGPPAIEKTDASSSRFLLPWFAVEAGNPGGLTTLFAVVNEMEVPIQVEISYHEVDRPATPQAVETVEVAANGALTRNLRDDVSRLNLVVDGDGIARGFVIVEALAGAHVSADYFRVDVANAFASGDRMVNVDPGSPDNDLCQRFRTRYLAAAGFTGTQFRFWVDAELAPTIEDELPVAFYSVYDEAGNLAFTQELRADAVAFEVDSASLTSSGPITAGPFGSIIIELAQDFGYLSAAMDADGQFSVGVEASCLDNLPPSPVAPGSP